MKKLKFIRELDHDRELQLQEDFRKVRNVTNGGEISEIKPFVIILLSYVYQLEDRIKELESRLNAKSN